MAATLLGLYDWYGNGADDGNLDLTAVWRVVTSSYLDGPVVAASAPGIPPNGSSWNIGNDAFAFARCLPGWRVTRSDRADGSPTKHWIIEQTYSTRPINPAQKGTNPLTMDPAVSGSFQQHRREATYDRYGDRLESSSFEPLQGEARQRNYHTAQVTISLNVASLDLGLYSEAMNSVNDSSLWGMPARHIQVSAFGWTEELYGDSKYYKVTLGFEVDFEGIDKSVINGGVMRFPERLYSLRNLIEPGQTVANKRRPRLYEANTDGKGNVGVYAMLTLDGNPVNDDSEVVEKTVEHYPSFNLLLLGIPSSL